MGIMGMMGLQAGSGPMEVAMLEKSDRSSRKEQSYNVIVLDEGSFIIERFEGDNHHHEVSAKQDTKDRMPWFK
jgi:hypothetical protein